MILNPSSLFKQSLPAILLILVTGFIVYSNTFHVPFVFDDQRSIVDNITIEKPSKVFYAIKLGMQSVENRVVAYLTFALNYQFGNLDVTGYHVVNLVIHLLTALLVYFLLRLTFQTPYFRGWAQGLGSQELDLQPSTFSLQPSAFIPLLAALLFVIHPVQTMAVTYIIQRMASLTTMFYLLSMLLYVRARLRMGRPESESQHAKQKIFPLVFCYAGSVLAAVLAMKTKEISFTLPLAVVLYEIFFFQGAWKRRLLYLLPLLATLPIIPLTIFGILNVGVDEQLAAEWQPRQVEQLRVQTSIPRLDYLFTQFRVIVTYLRLLVLPVNQNLDYDYPVYTTFFTPPVFLSFFLLTAIFAIAVYLFFVSRRTSVMQGKDDRPALRLVAFGIVWFFLTLSVESGLVPIRDMVMEYRLYLPAFGGAAAFATLFWLMVEKLTGPSRGKLVLLSAALLVMVLGFATYQRNSVWGDSIRLWQDTVSKSPNKARPINNLGKALEDAGRRSEAFKAFSRAIKVDPSYYKAYYNLADLYLVSDQPDAALPLLQNAIRLKPDFWQAYVSVSAALMRAGRFQEVIRFVEQNLDRVRDNPEAHFYLGASYAFLGNREAALRELAIVSRGDPALAATLRGMLGRKSNHGIPHGRQ